MIILASQVQQLDNSAGNAPEDYSFGLEQLITVPIAEWLTQGMVQISTRIRTICTYSGSASISERFLNPAQYQIGQMAILSDGYVVDRQTLHAKKQEVLISHPSMPVFNTRPTVPQRFAVEVGGGHSHGINVAGVPICTSGEVLAVPGTGAGPLFASSEMPAGALCINTYPGEQSYQTIDNWLPGAAHQIQFNRLEAGWPDELSGVVYPGWFVGVGIETFIQQVDNQALPEPLRNLIVGSPAPAVYSYTCQNGFSVPAPNNPFCPPGLLQVGPNGNLECVLT